MQDEALKGRVAEHIKALEAEVAVLRTLRHRNIVRYLGTERTEDAFNIFLEYVPGGSIASLIDKFGPLQVHMLPLLATGLAASCLISSSRHSASVTYRMYTGAQELPTYRKIPRKMLGT
jgi:serine/threonine protein kinase